MTKRKLISIHTRFFLATALFLAPAWLAAQPEGIPIAELTQEQLDSLPGDSLVVWPRAEMTLDELRAKEAERREAHAAAIAATGGWAKRELAARETRWLDAEAAQASTQDGMVMELMAFTARLAADNPEMVRRAEANSKLRREANELQRQAREASSAGELKRIERKLRRLERGGGN